MRHHWLYGALALVTMGLFDRYYQRMAVAVIWALIFHHVLEKSVRVKMVMLMSAMLAASIVLPVRITQGRVMEIKDSYQIIRCGFSCVMIYSKDAQVQLDDVVQIDCQLQPVDSYDNFDVSTFASWAASRQIRYQGTIEKYNVVREGCSFRRMLAHFHQGDWLEILLLGKGSDSDSDYLYLLTSAGMHISFLITLIRKLLGYFFYPEQTLHKTTSTVFLLGWLFRFPYPYVRILVSLLLEMLVEDKRDRTGMLICIMALYRPYMIRSITFMIPMGMRFMNLFIEHRRRLAMWWHLITVQLYFYGYCDLANIFLFGLFRTVTGWLYGVSLATVLLPFPDIKLDWVLALRERIPALIINGRISSVLIVLGWVFIYRLDLAGRERYFYAMILLLVINHYQSCLRPFPTVSFLDVGQGDCAVISVPFSSRGLLIDTGGSYYKDIAGDLLIPYLRSQGISSVGVIVSHEDYDHCGALPELINSYRVSRVIWEKQDVALGNLTVRCLLKEVEFADINENSLISYVNLSGFGFLFTGDINSEVEELLVNEYQQLSVTVLKAAHHGSATGTSAKLLETYRIGYCIISAGRNNRYGHPAGEVLQRLDDYGVRVLNTQKDHAVRFTILRNVMLVSSAGGYRGVFVRRR